MSTADDERAAFDQTLQRLRHQIGGDPEPDPVRIELNRFLGSHRQRDDAEQTASASSRHGSADQGARGGEWSAPALERQAFFDRLSSPPDHRGVWRDFGDER